MRVNANYLYDFNRNKIVKNHLGSYQIFRVKDKRKRKSDKKFSADITYIVHVRKKIYAGTYDSKIQRMNMLYLYQNVVKK